MTHRLPLDPRLEAAEGRWTAEIVAALQRLGPSTLAELLAVVPLSDRQLLALVERADGLIRRDVGRFRAEDFGRVPFGALAARLFSAHRAARCAGAEGEELVRALTTQMAGRPSQDTRYDQRHVNARTVLLRALYLLHRGDLTGKSIVLLGDDDLTSIALRLVGGGCYRSLRVLEADDRIVRFLERAIGGAGTVERYDARDPLPPGFAGSADTFLCDPSRPLYELFLARATETLRRGGVLYTFIAPTHSPAEQDADVQRWLMTQGFLLTDMIPAFNEYQRYPASLPAEYARWYEGVEEEDAVCFTETLVRGVWRAE